MERAEELQEAINTLKIHLNIPIFKNDDEELVFIKAFFAKKEYLNDMEKNNPLRNVLKDLQKNLKHI